jgi:hypothetical protein
MSSVPEVALAEILKSAEVAPASAANARIVGDDPVIPTRYRIGAAGSAAIAAAGLAAASIWKMRTGRKQEVEVDVRAAVASLRSSRYMKLDGPAQRCRASTRQAAGVGSSSTAIFRTIAITTWRCSALRPRKRKTWRPLPRTGREGRSKTRL